MELITDFEELSKRILKKYEDEDSCVTMGILVADYRQSEAIFDIAKKEVHLDRFGKELKMRYIKGNALQKIASILDGNIIEALGETAEGIFRYKIK